MAFGRRSLSLAEELDHPWWRSATRAIFGTTLLLAGNLPGAIEMFERGLAAAEVTGAEAYLLRCAAPLASATGSPTVLADADRLLQQASIPAGGAWLFGDEACLSLARAWLRRGDPERARAVLAPLLAVAERVPWIATLAATLAVNGHVLRRARGGRPGQGPADPGRAAGPAARAAPCAAGSTIRPGLSRGLG